MKILFFSAVLLIVAYAPALSQSPLKPTASTGVEIVDFIRVEMEGEKPLFVKAADLAKLPRKDVKAKDHDGKDRTYSGVDLREVLKLAGVKFGADLRGPAMAYYLLVEAADKYRAVFALAELDDSYTDKLVILADTQDGKPLDAQIGPWQVVVPDEKKHARWVRQVTALSVKKAL